MLSLANVAFFNMIDVAAFAAFRLFELSNPTWHKNTQDKRKIFLKELAYDLAQDHLEKRCQNTLKNSTKIAMDLIGFKPKNDVPVKRKMPEIQVKQINHSLILAIFHYTVFLTHILRWKILIADVKNAKEIETRKTTKQQLFVICVSNQRALCIMFVRARVAIWPNLEILTPTEIATKKKKKKEDSLMKMSDRPHVNHQRNEHVAIRQSIFNFSAFFLFILFHSIRFFIQQNIHAFFFIHSVPFNSTFF